MCQNLFMEWKPQATRSAALRDLRRIPGVGPYMADDMYSLGVGSVDALRERDPQQLYDELCDRAGGPVDRCVLYVFRCARYFATTPQPDPELLKWWRWKD